MTGNPLAAALQRERDAQVAAAVAAERERVRRLLAVPALNALRCIPDGPIRNGCVITDGATVRERLREAYRAVVNGDEPSAKSEPSTETSTRPAVRHGEPLTGSADPSAHTPPRTRLLVPSPVVPLLDATLPWEALDEDHPGHDDFVRRTGRCFAGDDCPTHGSKETR